MFRERGCLSSLKFEIGSGLGHLAGLDCLCGYKHSLDLAARELDADALKIWAELTLGNLSYVRADTAALLALTLAVNDAAARRAFSCDLANSGHDITRLL